MADVLIELKSLSNIAKPKYDNTKSSLFTRCLYKTHRKILLIRRVSIPSWLNYQKKQCHSMKLN